MSRPIGHKKQIFPENNISQIERHAYSSHANTIIMYGIFSKNDIKNNKFIKF